MTSTMNSSGGSSSSWRQGRFPTVQPGCQCPGHHIGSQIAAGGIYQVLGCSGQGCCVLCAVLRDENIVLGVNSYFLAVPTPLWLPLPLLFDASLDSPVYPTSLLSRILKRDLRINPQYARLAVHAQLALVSAWKIESHWFRPSECSLPENVQDPRVERKPPSWAFTGPGWWVLHPSSPI
jgi:hypothetical protein